MLASLRMLDHQITGRKGDDIFLIAVEKILYIESVDRKCFLYTADDVFESDLRLYEFEQQLEDFGFLRASKSMLIHLQNVTSLRADLNRRLRITLTNGEEIIVSRQYADELKKRLGVL